MNKSEQETLLKFPCEFPIKAFGHANDEFETAVLTIITQHVTDIKENAIRTRASKEGKYLAMTVSIIAKSKKQLDNIYLDLSACEHVLMTL